MDPLIRRRIYNLLCIKSIVTLALTGLFVFLAVTGQVSARDFITVFSIVIAFWEHFSAFSSFFLTENRV